MENNPDLNNQAAQYTLCFNTWCPKVETACGTVWYKYTTAFKHPAVRHQPLCYPAAGRRPALPQQQENTGGMGLQETLRWYAPHASPVPFTLNLEAIFNHSPRHWYRNQKLGLTRRESASAVYAGRMAGTEEMSDRYTEEYDCSTLSVFPLQGSRHSTTVIPQPPAVVAAREYQIVGSSCTT